MKLDISETVSALLSIWAPVLPQPREMLIVSLKTITGIQPVSPHGMKNTALAGLFYASSAATYGQGEQGA
ncbi:MAG: hypothetical protein MUO43_16405 [Desulfobacterales bacterium]|nr:hypothetical protein [Desulfobacterales bacterium]